MVVTQLLLLQRSPVCAALLEELKSKPQTLVSKSLCCAYWMHCCCGVFKNRDDCISLSVSLSPTLASRERTWTDSSFSCFSATPSSSPPLSAVADSVLRCHVELLLSGGTSSRSTNSRLALLILLLGSFVLLRLASSSSPIMRLLLLPSGLFFVILVWTLMAFENYCTLKFAAFEGFYRVPRYSELLKAGFLFLMILYEVSLTLAWISHVLAVLTDPGTTKHAPFTCPTSVGNAVYCGECGGRWKPPRAHHCRSCKECIFRMDHHCPWINNCVGLSNQKHFILFLAYTGTASLVNLIILFVALLVYITAEECQVTPLGAFSMICVFGIAAFFFYMTMEFLVEQWEAIETNSTLIENYKRLRGRKASAWESLEEVFGKSWQWWAIPIPPFISPDYSEPVFAENGSESATETTGVSDRKLDKVEGCPFDVSPDGCVEVLRGIPSSEVPASSHGNLFFERNFMWHQIPPGGVGQEVSTTGEDSHEVTGGWKNGLAAVGDSDSFADGLHSHYRQLRSRQHLKAAMSRKQNVECLPKQHLLNNISPPTRGEGEEDLEVKESSYST